MLSAALGLLSAGIGGLSSFGGSISTARMAQQEAQANRDWQERMSNTAHQREVSDLRAAGLNPILSATGGQGASSPSGSMANIPDFGSSLSGGLQAGSSAYDTAKNKTSVATAQTDNIKTDTALKASQVMNTDQDTSNKLMQGGLINEQIENTRNDTALKSIDYALKQKDLDWYDRKILTDLKTKMITAQAQSISASASQLNSKANMINANLNQQWRPFESGGQMLKDVGGLVLGGFGSKAKGIKKVGETIHTIGKKGNMKTFKTIHYGK